MIHILHLKLYPYSEINIKVEILMFVIPSCVNTMRNNQSLYTQRFIVVI